MPYENSLEEQQLINSIKYSRRTLTDSVKHIKILLDTILEDENTTNELFKAYVKQLNESTDDDERIQFEHYIDIINGLRKELQNAKTDLSKIIVDFITKDHVRIL